MTEPRTRTNKRSINYHLVAGIGTAFLLCGVVGGWAVTTDISGAVIAGGSLVVDSSAKKVQHLTGGIVGKLLVRDGSHVQGGDVVIRLDPTTTQANLAIVMNGLNQFVAQKARLASERDKLEDIRFPKALTDRQSDPDVAEILAGERQLFQVRRKSQAGKKLQLSKQIDQSRQEIIGLTAAKNSKTSESVLIAKQLESVHSLWDRQLTELDRLIAIERQKTTIDGDIGRYTAAIAQSEGKIAETELQIIQVDEDAASEDAKDMRDIDTKIGEYVERKVAAEDQLKRIDIRAPQTGTVHELSVHTVGGVVPAGEQLMLIVPDADLLVVEAKVQPQDVDQLFIGQPAGLRFTAFSQRTTPEVNGTVQQISADVTTDTRTGQSHYTVRVAVPPEEVARLGAIKLVPGMPVETFIKTGDRSVASYFIKPMMDQAMRAFREG
ncbi:HlyD family type I secretion periplasmic adaptor subunit [Phyllobacterium sp. LjRoot231]|uniref:HlyD family type I secretion periplasmic adaptor subunit n=1 Tax=Phyllobacterium sp. LjRoot231 TaxID=3342289 RepID=UPI003ED08503